MALSVGCAAPGASAPASFSASVPAPTAARTPKPVIVDTDMAADDWLAILYILNRPEVEVVAVTVTGTGEAHCEPGVRNALALVALAGQPDIAVACGRETPLAGTTAFPDSWRQRVDELLGIDIPDGPAAPSTSSAAELLDATLRAAPEPVTLLTLGPLTNIAELLDGSPDIAERIAAVYVMGGAVDVDGNVGVSGVGIENRFAEWNVYVDPLAAKVVLDSGVAVTLVPLDATNHAPITLAFQERLAGDATTPEAQFASSVLERQIDSITSGFHFFWDPFAAAILVDQGLTSLETRDLSVEVSAGANEGRIIAAPGAKPIRFAMSADAARFEQHFLDTLNGRDR
jgi:inosine-uridine nucleoside N-ribohydrolase